MNLITEFDPWRSTLCTCPPKLTFNPYTGCDHGCVYCYASSYVPRFFHCRPKKDLIRRLRREATKLKGELISIANSSDPYPRIEATTNLTRKCLEVLSQHDCMVQIVTKSNQVIRDADLLKKIPSTVSLTITTDSDNTARLIEPYAPPPSERLKIVETLTKKNIPASVRIDPIIPFLNDDFESLIRTLADIGVKHVTASTYKIKPDNWQRLRKSIPTISEKLERLYFAEGEKIGSCIYLPQDLRLKLLKNLRVLTENNGMKFGTCREGLSHLNTAACDGSWLITHRP